MGRGRTTVSEPRRQGKARLNALLSPALKEYLARRAFDEKRTVSALVEEVLTRGLAAEGVKIESE